ncbi:MAG TPA: DUF4333 domain-containing protein [Actinomycetospora sp.]|uniref:DUF4333 domain-containing protein n=1 Tax=Actinomycetospora sp. TaxID=1872135 RepID=UPI002F42350B
MTSPSGPGEAGGDQPLGTGARELSESGAAEHTPTPEAEPAPEPAPHHPATGVRWVDTEGAQAGAHPEGRTPGSATLPDDDATPASGTPAPGPGDVVPDRATGGAPAVGAPWPHPAYQQGAPPTWPQATPAWAPPAPNTPPRDPARRRRIRRIVLLVVLGLVVIAAIVVALLAFLVGPRFARYDVLDHAAVERGVTDVVTRDWHRQITDVVCPDGERVRPGVSFSCTATVDGRPQQVPVDVVDENGGYEVGQPR